ncbi:MAG TPA: hypothetical protein VGM98_17170, partial [Schlesneria sp.]
MKSATGRRSDRLALLVIALWLGVATSLVVAQDEKSVVTDPPSREEQTTLPKLADMVLPDAEELLRSRPFDWLVLKNSDVLVVDPLPNRPDILGAIAIRHDM